MEAFPKKWNNKKYRITSPFVLFFSLSFSFSPIARSLSEWKVERGFATVCFTSKETK